MQPNEAVALILRGDGLFYSINNTHIRDRDTPPPLASRSHMAAETSLISALLPAITLLGFGASAALASKALKISPIVGYLIAGILLGPGVLNLIANGSTTHLLAELGVVLLLFDIGMHVSLRELKESWRDLTRLAPAHLLLTGLTFAGILYALEVSWPIALAVGLSLGLSSTAVVARILKEREQAGCPIGRTATHILIFQDIAAIFLMIFATSLGGQDHDSTGLASVVMEALGSETSLPLAATLGLSLVQTLIAFAVALLVGRFLITPIFRTLLNARNPEAFTAFSLLLVLSAACATMALGLTITLGAFLAGLAVSGTPFRHQVQLDIEPFRGLLLSFFFMSIGIGLDLAGLVAHFPVVIAGALLILVVKTSLGYFAARISGWSVPGAAHLSTLLAQGSEFTLVILSIGAIVSDLPTTIMSAIIAAVALSLAFAPFWADIGVRLSLRLAERRKTSSEGTDLTSLSGERPTLVIGMTPAGRLAIDALIDHNLPYIAMDHNADRFLAAISDGYQVSFGDTSNLKLFDAVGASHARAVVLGDPRYDVSARLTSAADRRPADLIRFAALQSPEDLARFEAIGIRAHLIVAEPKGLEMVIDMLGALGIDNELVAAWLTRQHDIHTIGEGTETQPEPTDPDAKEEAA